MCIYCTYIHMTLCVYECIHNTYIHTYTHIKYTLHISVCMYTQTVHMYVSTVHVHVCVCIPCICAHTCSHTYVHIHMFLYTCAHTHVLIYVYCTVYYSKTSLIGHNWECQFYGGLAGLADQRVLHSVHACTSFFRN